MRMTMETLVMRQIVDFLIRVNATLCFVPSDGVILVYGHDPRWHVYMKVELKGEVTEGKSDGKAVSVSSQMLKQRINALLDTKMWVDVWDGHVVLGSENYRCKMGHMCTGPQAEQTMELNELFMCKIQRDDRLQLAKQVDGMQSQNGMVSIRVRPDQMSMVNGDTEARVRAEVTVGGEGDLEYTGVFSADWFKKIMSTKLMAPGYLIFSDDFRTAEGVARRSPVIVRYVARRYDCRLMLTEGVCRTRPNVAANRRVHKAQMKLDAEIAEYNKNQKQ